MDDVAAGMQGAGAAGPGSVQDREQRAALQAHAVQARLQPVVAHVHHWPAAGRIAEQAVHARAVRDPWRQRSEEHTSELQSLMRISYAVFRLKKITTQLPLM